MTTTPETAPRPLRTLDTALIVGATIEEARRYPGGHLELTLSNGVTLRSTSSTIEEPKRCECHESNCPTCSADSWATTPDLAAPAPIFAESALYGRRQALPGRELCYHCLGEGAYGPDGTACVCARYGKHPGFQLDERHLRGFCTLGADCGCGLPKASAL